MNIIKPTLSTLTICLGWSSLAEAVIWQNTFEKTEKLNGGVFGLPVQGFSCHGKITNRSRGKNGDLKIISKSLDSEHKYSGEKSLKLEISAKKSTFIYFKSAKLKKKIAVVPGTTFSGYLYKSKDIPAKTVVKVCPRFETIKTKDKKKTYIEHRIGGFSPNSGLTAQSKKNWYFFSADMSPIIRGICEKKGYSFKDTYFIGWSILINGSTGEKPLTIYVDDVKLFKKEDPRRNRGENIARGKPYRWNIAPNAFPNGYQGNPMCKDKGDNTQLTNDRLASRCWFDKETVGWWQENKPINITIDLGKSQPIKTVMIHLSSEVDGKRVPSQTRIFTSDDKENYHLSGEMSKKAALKSWLGNKAAGSMDGNPLGWVIIDNMKSMGRYVTVSMQSSALYLDEICIFSGDLKSENVKMAKHKMYTNLKAVTPFYKHRSVAVATNVVTPMHVKLYNRKPLDLYIDLPEGLTVAGEGRQASSSITADDVKYKRYTIKKAKQIYLKTTLPEGKVSIIRLEGMNGAGNLAGVIQKIPVEIISIPETKPFKKILTNVGFANFDYWERWPDVVKNYKHIGLNLFTPFGQTDYYYRMWKRQDRNVVKIIKKAKQAGLYVGGNYSPFCNAQINNKSLKPRKAVYINSGKKSNVNCPRVYIEQYLKKTDNQDINSIIYGFKNGLDIMFLDSEPHWSGNICACSKCDKLWKEFLKDKDEKAISIKQAASMKPALLQKFWDVFYIELWKRFKDTAIKSAHGGMAKIGVYGCPGTSKNYRFGNRALFAPVYKAKALDFGNPSLYGVQTPELGKVIRKIKANNPDGTPLYVWLTAGGSSLTYETTPANFKNRVYEVLMNGAKGVIIWTAKGFNTREYQAFAKAISVLQPHEKILLNGKNSKVFSTSDKAVKLTELKYGKQILLLVTRYDKSQPTTVTVKSSEVYSKATMLTTGKMQNKNNSLNIYFDGSEKSRTKIILIEK